MSVNIVPTQQPGTWLQRLTGTEPRTVVEERSTTTVSSVAGGSFNFRTALRNGGIGAAIAGALGGVSLLGKVALPLIGKVASVGGLARLAGVGGAIGLATAALPIIVPALQRNPTAKAAAVGAGIGAAAGLVLPFVPIWLGAGIGAGVGLLIHNRRTHPAPTYEQYPGYEARPGYVPYGTGTGPVPAGLVPVTPNYGSYAGAAMNPYGVGGYGGYGSPAIGGYGGYGTAGYPVASGYGNPLSLPMQAQGQVPAAVGVPAAARPAPAAARPAVGAPVPARAASHPGAKTFTDGAGNVRQVGTGKVLKAAHGAAVARTAAPAAPAAYGMDPAVGYGAAPQPGVAGMAQLTNPASYLPGMASALPFAGGSPLSATPSMAQLAAAMPQGGAAAPAGSVPTLSGVQMPEIPVRPTA